MRHKYQKDKGPGWLFHPFEFAFCGYSGSGKTRVIITLIRNLSPKYKIGFVKHDVHGFEMDRKGKDTYLAMSSGASSLLISGQFHFAEIHSNPVNIIRQNISLLDADLLLIEGYKNSNIPKFIFVDQKRRILKEFYKYQWKNVLGFVGSQKNAIKDLSGYPYYYKEDITGIQNKILEIISERIRNIHIFGLVLTGCKSVQMKREKSTLIYHEDSKIRYCYQLLSKLSQKVYISIREEQASNDYCHGLPQIHDQFLGMGPIGGILTAMVLHPNAAWLVLGCDLPFADLGILTRLVQERNPLKMATAYIQYPDGFPEPFCTLYEPKIRPRFFNCLGLGYTTPLKTLMNAEIQTITLRDGDELI